MNMNLQETFDRVAIHLVEQNRQAILDDGSSCAYRGEDGTKCAFGILIPDQLYSQCIENQTACAILNPHVEYSVLENTPFDEEEIEEACRPIRDYFGIKNPTESRAAEFISLIRELQRVHDSVEEMGWPEELARVGRDFNLTLPARLIEELPEEEA